MVDMTREIILENIATLEELRQRYLADKELIEGKIAQNLAKQEELRRLLTPANGKSNVVRKRNPRGYNEKIITQLIGESEAKGKGLGAAEIRDTSGLSWSSVRQALESNPDRFERGDDGLWYLKKHHTKPVVDDDIPF
ncbi:MAG TPA: hypothetical protein PLJ47_01540 [Candidatus Hydrogenedentes bacterium]|nr:hypothetical protein [Candidatus Hydrogenedentota bacterium]HRK33248.1 hypothetical protein [Candidatus Hydrogenedentota bacterium]